MSQAEIAGGSLTPADELPSKGRRLHEIELRSAPGRVIRLSDYRGRSNLVLIFTDDRPASKQLLTDLAGQYTEIKDQEAEILVIVRTQEQASEVKQQLKLPYPVLADQDGRIYRYAGAIDAQQRHAAAVYVTDRFAEVFAVYRTRDGQPLPGVADILSWLEFVNSQCPECEPPEWPA